MGQQDTTQRPKDYTQRFSGNQAGKGNKANNNSTSGGNSQGNGKHFQRSAPDSVIHHPPGFMFLLGGLGVLSGLATNVWQMITTFIAIWEIENPNGTIVNHANQPMKFAIAGIIAFGSQLGLLMLTFKIDTSWKRKATSAGGSTDGMKGYGSAAIEVVQHIDLVTAWGLISFVIDTIGDFTFVSGVLANIDFLPQAFLTALYAIFLYALSTVAFARSIEYIWSGLAATARYMASQNQRRHN